MDGSEGSLGFILTELSSANAITTDFMTKSNVLGGVVYDLIYVISSYLILSNALAASSNNGNTLDKSASQDDFNALA